MKTVNCTPTWEAATQIYIACLENPKADKSAKEGARAELLRLARAFDEARAEVKAIKASK